MILNDKPHRSDNDHHLERYPIRGALEARLPSRALPADPVGSLSLKAPSSSNSFDTIISICASPAQDQANRAATGVRMIPPGETKAREI
jgi:hypothetical protein